MKKVNKTDTVKVPTSATFRYDGKVCIAEEYHYEDVPVDVYVAWLKQCYESRGGAR